MSGVIPGYRRFANIRMSLLPYLQNEAAYAVAEGEPMMRPLLLDFPDDPIAWRVEDAYCLGRDLLVCPVVEEGATVRRVYLPQGDWRDFWTGAAVNGGQWHDVPAPWDRIPVFVRGGAVIPLNLGEWGELGDGVGPNLAAEVLTLMVYPGEPGAGEIVLRDGQSIKWRTAIADGGVEVTVVGTPLPLRIKMPGGVGERLAEGEGERGGGVVVERTRRKRSTRRSGGCAEFAETGRQGDRETGRQGDGETGRQSILTSRISLLFPLRVSSAPSAPPRWLLVVV
ncbi:MAG: hypothetical protein IPK16_17475 [Anaerolineales bacterium]|nr:hypothetical protein [Anaerolineales bacterium]